MHKEWCKDCCSVLSECPQEEWKRRQATTRQASRAQTAREAANMFRDEYEMSPEQAHQVMMLYGRMQNQRLTDAHNADASVRA